MLHYAASAIGCTDGRAKRAAALITLLFAVIVFRFFTRPADPGRADLPFVNLVETFTPPYETFLRRVQDRRSWPSRASWRSQVSEGTPRRISSKPLHPHICPILTTNRKTFHLFIILPHYTGHYFLESARATSRLLSLSFIDCRLSGAAFPFARPTCSLALPFFR